MRVPVVWVAGAVLVAAGGSLSADESAVSWELETGGELVERSRRLAIDARPGERAPRRQVLRSVRVHLGADRILRQDRRTWYFPTVESVQEYGSDVIAFDARTDRVVVREAATIRPDGEVIPFDPTNAQFVDSDTYDQFSDTKQAVLLFPRLEPGSLAVVRFEVTTARDALEGPWSHWVLPQQFFRRDSFEFAVSWEPGVEVNWSNGSAYVTCERTESTMACSGRNIPGAQPDPGVRPHDEFGAIVVSEYRDWDHVIGVATGVFEGALAASDTVAGTLRDLVDDGMTRPEVVARLHEFVAREIRYVSVSERGHAITPHAVDETLARGYGDCKDKSALLTALLRRAGVDAYPVLVATRRLDPERLGVAALTYFDHMLVCFSQASARTCVDTVDPYTGNAWGAHWVQGRVGLALVPGSAPTSIPHDRYRWQLDVETSIEFDDRGGQTETSTRSYLGAYAGLMRSYFADRSGDEMQRWAREEYERNLGDMAAPSFEFSGLDDIAEPFVVHATASYPPLVDTDDDFDYSERSAWLGAELDSVRLDNEHYRRFFPGLRVNSEYSFIIPARWRFEGAGPSLNFEFEFGTMHRDVRVDGGSVRFSTLLELPARWIENEETARFNEFLRVLGREGRMSLFAETTAEP